MWWCDRSEMGMRVWLAFVGVLAIAGGPALAGKVVLRGTAFLDRGEAVTLGAIATLDGADAEALSEFVVVAEAGSLVGARGWARLDAESVRAAMARGGVNLGRIALSGSACTIRVLDEAEASKDGAGGGDGLDESREPKIATIPAGATVRRSVTLAVLGALGAAASDVKMAFPSGDSSWLDAPRGSLRIVTLPRSTASSSRMVLEVRLYDGDALVDERSVRVDVLVRRRAGVLERTLNRGETVHAGVLRAEERWVSPPIAGRLIAPEEATGLLVRKRLQANELLMRDDLEEPVLVERNELVRVMAISRGVVIEGTAYAVADGRLGERVTLRRAGSRERFVGVVEGRGRVVVRLDN